MIDNFLATSTKNDAFIVIKSSPFGGYVTILEFGRHHLCMPHF